MSSIIDNSRDNLLITHVNKLLDNTEFSRMAVGFFYLSGFEAIREKLHKIKRLRLLIGNRTDQRTLEELVKGHLNKELTDKEIRKQNLQNAKQRKHALDLTKNEYAEDLALMEQNINNEEGLSALWELIRDKRLDIKVYTKGILHSKAYIFDLPEKDYLDGIAIVGSSNLSISGLQNNSELNVKVTNPNDYQEVRTWFDKLWDESEDFNESFMNVIQESWFKKEVTPYEIYIKTLYTLVKERIEIKEYSSLTAFDQSRLYPFQKDAYNRALSILENEKSPYNGVFISDVVGLGKSFIAIALMSYYWSIRQRSSLVICPASLKKMWEDYRDEHHLRCKILPYSDLLYPDDNTSYTLNDDPEYDGYGVVVIDESHNFRNPDTQRYKILAPYLQGKRVILLTATPQNNTVWDLYHQIKLFHQSDVTDISITPNNIKKYFDEHDKHPEKIQELLQHFLIRRTRKDITNSPKYAEWVSKHKFPDRKLHTLEYNIEEIYSKSGTSSLYEMLIDKLFRENAEDRYRYSIYNLTGFVKKNLRNKKEYIGLSNTGEWIRGLLRILLFKRLESSVEAFYLSIERMLKRHSIILSSIEQGYIITGKAEQLELFLDGDESVIESNKVNRYSVDDFEIEMMKKAISDDVIVLESILRIVEPIYSDETKDDKFAVFLKEIIRKHGKEKILIFSEFSDTVHYLHKNLQKLLPQVVIARISSLTANSDEKASIIRRFSPQSQTKAGLGQYEKEIQILITTDVLSEGQNLQDSSIVVNYDFHWNPVRLIQRIGRVDRIGSDADTIHVYNFLPDRNIDHELVLQDRVQNRINEIQQIFGLDSKILTQDEILNDKSVFAIYSDKDDTVLDAEDSITTIYDKAEQLLQTLKKNSPGEYNRITTLRDGIRTARLAADKGTYVYLSSGNLHRLYFSTKGKISENVGEILSLIEAQPDHPKPLQLVPTDHDADMKQIYEKFKKELWKRQSELESSQITAEQRYFLERLQTSFNLFTSNPFAQKKIDELYKVYSKEIPDYAKSQLRRMKKENPPDDILIDILQRLVESARIIPFQEKEIESEKMIIRTICSEGFISHQ